MNVLKVKKGETLARKQDKVMEWYLIQEGSVIRQFAFAEIIMHRNAIVGILENEWFACDYVANEDTTLIVIPCKNAQDLRKILSEHENFRPIFLRTAVEQRHQALCLYASLQKKCMLLHNAAETLYSEYKNLCSEKLLDEQDFPRMEQFAALKMQHRAENWEIANSNSLVRSYLKEYMQLMIKDDSLCVGAIMEAAAQMRRVTQGIGEMVNYLQYNRDILFSDSRDDIFHLFFAMAVQQSQKKQDISEIKKRLLNMVDVMTKLDVYDKKQMAEAHELCENYDFTKESEGRINIMREDCIAHIMEYAGYGNDMIRDFHSIVQQYRELPDMMSTDNEARQLRREITKVFYDIYTKAFMRSVEELVKPSPIMMMFFNFGFMDAEVLGETNTNALYNLTDSLGLFHSANVYTVYDWLVQIYQGKKEPSRNEFDQDFNAFLLEEKRTALRSYAYNNERIKESLDALFQTSEERGRAVMHTQTIYSSKTPDISVIIPVYNTADYLPECLDSVVGQTFDSFEIIIVNDGSTDKSQTIIDDYVYQFSDRIRAFTIPNGGLGNARNYGIGKARGKYLAFVDSDDFIHCDMLKKMYEAARQHNADCVMADYIAFWDDGRQEHVRSVEFPDAGRPDIMKYSAKYGTVNICTKLVARELFDIIRFPAGFYEDLATTPILLSWAKNVSYLREGLYFYRQRVGSITSIKSGDKRLLDCYAAWDRIREHANPLFEKEIQFAVYWSLNFFCTNFLDDFTKQSKEYYDRNRDYFRGNAYIADAIREETFLDFEHLDTIPKIIHYCWFGNGEKSELIQKCMDSWKKYAPDFEIMEWNESNCNIHTNRYVEEAYEKKQYAFVSDYFRLKALYDHGGVYMDTDMELHQPLESFLYAKAFFAFETPLFIHAGILGAEKNCGLIGELRRSYEEDTFDLTECPGEDFTIPRRLTQLLIKRTNLQLNGKSQLLEGNIRVFSANRMTVNMHDGRCVCEHHYEGSWLRKDNGPAPDYTYEVLKHYFTWDLLHGDNDISLPGDTAQLLTYYKSECDRYENSTCWKITKPLRILGDFLKKIFRRNEVS